MKIKASIIVLIMITITGCSSITPLTSRENNIIGEYAAGVILKYDKNSSNRLVNIVETEPEVVVDEIDNIDETEGLAIVEEETTGNSELLLNDALKIEKLLANYDGYFITDSYPDASSEDEAVFTMNAVKGYRLLVLEFSLENPNNESITEDILSKNLSFNLMVNDEIKVNSQLTMLLDDLSSFKEEVEANSVKELVLIFQIPERYENEDNISSMTLNIKDVDTSLPIRLK